MKRYKFPLIQTGKEDRLVIESDVLNEEQNEVLLAIAEHKKLTISQLVGLVNDKGAHEKHEAPRKPTTVRKMYQIVRDLREAKCPLVGDSKGIWIAKSTNEVADFANYLEKKAYADIKSMLELRDSMLSMVSGQTQMYHPIPELNDLLINMKDMASQGQQELI